MIDEAWIRAGLNEALAGGAEFAEIYLEDRTTTTLQLEEACIRSVRVGKDRGAGVRVVHGGVVGYAYTEIVEKPAILEAAKAARTLAAGSTDRAGKPAEVGTLQAPEWKGGSEFNDGARKRDVLLRANEAARAVSGEVQEVRGVFQDYVRDVLVANSEGQIETDRRTATRFNVAVYARRGDVLQVASDGRGAQMGLELFDETPPESFAKQAAESAVRMLDARPAPAGKTAVVINHGWGGVLVHEACGHCLEGDFVAKGISPYADKIGQKVAADLVTVVDDGTVERASGSYRVDDEGTDSQRTVLIEKGVLRNYMTDRTHAAMLGVSSSGSGRRESFRVPPMVRMRNTFIEGGETAPEDIIADTKKGVYVARMGGGQADLGRGDFLFSATEAYLIENGKITAPVRGVTLIGNGFQALGSIDAVGSDFVLSDPGMGGCGKIQSAVVCVGQPTIRIPELQVGGTAIS